MSKISERYIGAILNRYSVLRAHGRLEKIKSPFRQEHILFVLMLHLKQDHQQEVFELMELIVLNLGNHLDNLQQCEE